MRTRYVIASMLIGALAAGTALTAPDAGNETGERDAVIRGEKRGVMPERRPPMQEPGMSPLRDAMIVHALSNPDLMGKLGIEAETADRLRVSLDTLRNEQIRLNAQKEIAAMEQVRLLAEQTIDEDAVMAAVEKTAAIHTELAKLQVRSIIEIRKTLTPAQLERARMLVRERLREKFNERSGEQRTKEGPRGDRPRRGWGRANDGGGEESPGGKGLPE